VEDVGFQVRILISGHTGMISRIIQSGCTRQGIGVVGLSRRSIADGLPVITWDRDDVMVRQLERVKPDVVIHLAGENIAGGRWTRARKKKIYTSRIDTTRKLVRVVNALPRPPSLFMCASAIGFYGGRGRHPMDESSPGGEGFLADTCRDWEEACSSLDSRVRTVCLRFGMILSGERGALAAMLPIFRLGLGGRLGRGAQVISWIHPDDVVGSVLHILEDGSISGPVNLVSPNPASNREFTRVLARVLNRPAFFHVPGVILRLFMGGMADELLLGGCHVVPRILMNTGYDFRHPDLEKCLQQGLQHPS
jgi:uncharacterized protein (TIGR01777 family)